MSLIKVLIVDDEPLARDKLKRLLGRLDGYEIAGEAETGEQVLAILKEQAVDLALLDISMPGMGGLACAEQLVKLDTAPVVIFTTAYDQHALAAFAANALDYLLKPINLERLEQALDKAKLLIAAKQSAKPAAVPSLTVKRRNELTKLPLDQILAIQAEQKYLTLYHSGGEDLIDGSLKQFEHEHGDLFIRSHRNCLVAKQAIEALLNAEQGHCLQLKGCDFRPLVSRRHLAEIKAYLI